MARLTSGGSGPGLCAAPHLALSFRPDGHVMPCCTGYQPLGRVSGPRRQSLREIWNGDLAREVRAAVDAGDASLGCVDCGLLVDAGQRDRSLAAVFDRWVTPGQDEFPRFMDFALSNRCNLECVMCNGGYSSTIRRRREHRAPLEPAYDDRFFDELEEFLPHLAGATFKGGEPFLIPEYRRVWDRLLAIGSAAEVSVTSNGTVWNAEVDRYVRGLRMHVGLSVDAVDPAVLESIRVGIDARAFWQNVERFGQATSEAGGSLTLSLCLMRTNWRELVPFLREADRRGIPTNLIWVTVPSAFDLLATSDVELGEVLHELEAARSEAGWSADATARLAEASGVVGARIETGRRRAVPVTLTPPAGRPTHDDRLAGHRRTLQHEVGVELVEVRYADGLIASATSPAWATWLHPERWIGTSFHDIPTTMAASAEATIRLSVEQDDDGVVRGEAILDTPTGRRELVIRYVPPPPDGTTGGQGGDLLLGPRRPQGVASEDGDRADAGPRARGGP